VNNSVFRRFLKVSSDVDDVTVGDRLFHARTAATGNARSRIAGCLVRGTINDAVDDERIRIKMKTVNSEETIKYDEEYVTV